MPTTSSFPSEIQVSRPRIDPELLVAAIEACLNCEISCIACTDVCASENQGDELVRCMRLTQDCADVCGVTARLLARLSEADETVVMAQVEACVVATAGCAAECARHALEHHQCLACAESCERCHALCLALIGKAHAVMN